jgi:hypothetical protein
MTHDANGAGHVESFDEEAEFDPDELVHFEDEEGTTRACVVLAVVEHEGNDYAMLAPVEQVKEDDGHPLELFLFQVEELEDGTERYSYIEDEQTYKQVQAFCQTLIDDPESVTPD